MFVAWLERDWSAAALLGGQHSAANGATIRRAIF